MPADAYRTRRPHVALGASVELATEAQALDVPESGVVVTEHMSLPVRRHQIAAPGEPGPTIHPRGWSDLATAGYGRAEPCLYSS